MSKTGTQTGCWFCGEYFSSYGIASHMRMHYRMGEITRDWIPGEREWDGYWHYRVWKKGERDA